MWGPKNVTPDGPRPLRNVVASNKKVPLTDIENADQPDAGAEHRSRRDRERAAIPDPRHEGEDVVRDQPAGLRLRRRAGDAVRRSAGPRHRSLRGHVEVLHVLPRRARDEPRHAGRGEPGAVGDARAAGSRSSGCPRPGARRPIRPSSFDYNVTPHMVGNLADLPFDGQTAITQRGLKGPRGVKPARAKCNYVGNDRSPARGSAAVRGLRRPEARVPRTRALGCSRRPAQRAARHRVRARTGVRRSPRERLPRDGDRGRPAVPAGRPPGQLRLTRTARCAIIGEWRRAASHSATPTAGRSRTCASRSPTAATSAASTACPPTGCRGSSGTRCSRSRRSSASSPCWSGSASRTSG